MHKHISRQLMKSGKTQLKHLVKRVLKKGGAMLSAPKIDSEKREMAGLDTPVRIKFQGGSVGEIETKRIKPLKYKL